MKNKALVVIDAQEDFTRGSLRNEDAIRALPVIKDVVSYAYNNFQRKVIYTKDTHTDSYLETQEGKNLPIKHCIKGTDGWRICQEVLLEGSEVIEKHAFGCTSWDMRMLRTLDEMWICGFATDICVSANFQIIKAYYPELPIVIIEDACAGTTPEMHKAALDVMKSCQAKVIKWEDLKNKE